VAGRICVLVSGSGSLLQALIDSPIRHSIVAVGADRPHVPALTRAEAANIPTFIVDPRGYANRLDWDAAMADRISAWEPDVVVSAGFMRILGPEVVKTFRGRLINTHPALLPAFPGAHAVRDALAYGVKVTGSTVHFIDEGVDTGPIIAQQAVPVLDGDDVETLHERIKVIERQLLLSVVTELMKEQDS
jgi:phosphoribosylglycinamide formyltransferase-1